MRRLATIRRIAEIKPIPNADSIEVAVVDGWECVIKKNEGFKAGDSVVYIEIDSIVPDKPEFEFLRDRKFRVRTIRLRGQVSQGLVLPTSILPKKYPLDADVTEVLGIKKYDPQAEQEAMMLTTNKEASNPIIKWLLRFGWFRKLYIKPKKGGFPAWIVKTDEERIQNKTRMFEIEKALGTVFSVTEKVDGQSVTFFLERFGLTDEFGVCSRNLRLFKPDTSSYWTTASQLNIKDVLKSIIGNEKRVVLQGEILGTGIQGNKYKVDGYDFYAFNLIYPNRKVPTEEMAEILKPFGIKTVPLLDNAFTLKDTIPEMVEVAKGQSTLLNIKREGIVLRNYKRNISFKVINPEFLLAEKD